LRQIVSLDFLSSLKVLLFINIYLIVVHVSRI
jgi:hypothetical protein